jgi:LysM repeat protein
VSINAFADLPWGLPIAKSGTMFTNKSTGNVGVYTGDQFFELDKKLVKAVDLSRWFTKSTGTLTAAGLSQVYTNVTVKPIVVNTLGTYLITPAGKRLLSNPQDFGVAASPVNTAFTAAIPVGGSNFTAPLLVQSGTTVQLIAKKQLRPIASSADQKALTVSLGAPFDEFSPGSLEQLTVGPPAFAPGALLKAKTSGKFYYVDDYSRLIAFSSKEAKDLLILRSARQANDADILANKRAAYAGGLVECRGVVYAPLYGELAAIDAAAISAWPAKPLHLSEGTCAKFVIASDQIGQFVKNASTNAGYYIQGGQKHLITSSAIYAQLLGTGRPYVTVEADFLAAIPTGENAKATTPVAPPVTTKTYKVVAGDTLGGIAVKFKTTVAKLKALNKLTSDIIKVGQVLTIP